jgi:hypothetical protein
MDFKAFCATICKQIEVPVTLEYGNFATGYLIVLAFIDGEFKELGELLYDVYNRHLYTEQELVEFGTECEYFRIGFSETAPSWCYKEGKFTFR